MISDKYTIKIILRKTAVLQGVIFLLAILATIFIIYFKWQKGINQEFNLVKKISSQNIKHYEILLNILSKRIEKKRNDIAEMLDVKKYNQFLHYKEPYIAGVYYLVLNSESKYETYTKLGKEKITILPHRDLFKIASNARGNTSYLHNGNLFIIKEVANSSIILFKVRTEEFIQNIKKQTSTTGKFSLKRNSTELLKQYNIHLMDNLILEYIPPKFIDKIYEKGLVIGVYTLLFIVSLLIGAHKNKAFLQCIFKRYNENVMSLVHKVDTLEEELYNLKQNNISLVTSFTNMRKLLIESWLFDVATTTSETNFSTINQVVQNCKSIFHLEFHNQQITYDIHLHTEKKIAMEKAITLYFIVAHFLYSALYRTPKGGHITITAYEMLNSIGIKIEDNGFDLCIRKHKEDDLIPIKNLLLEKIIQDNEVKITKIYTLQSNKIDIMMPINSDENNEIIPRYHNDSNIVIFPTNN